MIFENTPRSDDQMDQLLLNAMPASISATDLGGSDDDQLPENNLLTDPSDHHLIHEVITSKPLQEEGSRSIVVSDPLFATSEKIENQNVSDCVKFIRTAVEVAVRFVKFAADQVASLYTEFSDRTALAPNLAKILLVAERKGGKISIRDAQLAFTPKFRPNAQMVRSWFGELVALNYGVVKNSEFGKSLIFEITTKSTDQLSTTVPKSIPANVSSSTTTSIGRLQSLQPPSKSVDFVDEMIHSRLQTEPIQGEDSRSIVDDDLLFATSENFPTDEDVQKNIILRN